MNKKYQIFISSTYKDLIDPRNKVIESILSLYHFPIGMEMFSAADDEQWDIIRETIDSSDFYIILIGSRYGSLTKEGISYTEKEYDYAKEIGVPILSFVKHDSVPTTPVERESDPEMIRKIDDFKVKVTANKMCEFWRNSDELALKVNTALTKSFNRKKRVGWIRGDSVSEKASKELLELSKENRELREQVARLEALSQSRMPEIELNILRESPLKLHVPDVEWEKYYKFLPEKLPLEVPEYLRDYLTLDAIKSYNRKLPSETEVEEYNAKFRTYLLSKFSIALDMEVNNVGNGSASNVSIEINFPDTVRIIKNKALESISFPKNIMPENPLDKAQKEYERSNRNTFSFSDLPNIMADTSMLQRHNLLAIPPTPNINIYYSIEGNSFFINLPKLLHSRKDIISDYLSIIPFREGDGLITINIICEEMESPKNIQIPINIETDNSLNILEIKQ